MNISVDGRIVASNTNIYPFPNVDLALLTFTLEGDKNCPYKSLELGDYDKITVGEDIYIYAYQRKGNKNILLPQLSPGTITSIQDPSLAQGYAISY